MASSCPSQLPAEENWRAAELHILSFFTPTHRRERVAKPYEEAAASVSEIA